MDKDEITGKAKDMEGRIQRQAGEWTGNEETQAEGAAKQAEGKVQNAWGKAKDAVNSATDENKKANEEAREEDEKNQRRTA